MSGLCKSVPLVLAAAIGVASPTMARAGAPEPGEALRIVEAEPEPVTFAQPPPPVIDPVPEPAPRIIDGERPMPGTGLITLGVLGMGASAVMMITALAGPGWADLERRDAAILGGLSIPLALAGAGMVVGGSKSHRKYERWVDRNQLSPPDPNNGFIVAGAAVTVAGLAGVGFGVQHAITDPTAARGDWVAVGAASVLSAAGLAILTGGMIGRSKFAAWERQTLTPGAWAGRGGAGLSLSGRF